MGEMTTNGEVKRMVRELPGLARQVAAMFPEGSVVVERARFERLRETVNGIFDGLTDSGHTELVKRLNANLQPGDRDPLP